VMASLSKCDLLSKYWCEILVKGSTVWSLSEVICTVLFFVVTYYILLICHIAVVL